MKYSQLIGVAAAIGVIILCFLPWSYIPSLNVSLDGFNGTLTDRLDFGKQGKAHVTLSLICLIFFALPKIWAKRTNMLFAGINLSLAIKNLIIFSMCRNAECPEVQPALYLLLCLSIVMFVMTLLPKIELKGPKNFSK
ncbi:MAG: hypothetical protein K0Q66_1978 [Chitinophagaceae bacterium]|jgi:hypothetical protein|nr:hypothetical protein [Chitinophagaceae bacterium]